MRLGLGLDLPLSFIPSSRRNLLGEISRYGEMPTQLPLAYTFVTLRDSILPPLALRILPMTEDSECFRNQIGYLVSDI